MLDAIQALWVGPRLSTMERLCISSFLRNGHPFHLYVYESPEGVPAGTIIRDANEILPASAIFTYREYPTYAGFANFFRYKLLAEKGGWFVDLDTICLRPFQFPTPHVFSSQHGNGQPSVNLAAIKVPAGCGVMRWAWDRCQTFDPRELRWGQSGPELITRAVHEHALAASVTSPDVFNPVDYPAWNQVLEPGVPWQADLEPFAIHLWNEMWRRADQDKDAQYDSRCLYEQLKTRYLSLERRASTRSTPLCRPVDAPVLQRPHPRDGALQPTHHPFKDAPKPVEKLSISAVVLTKNGAARLPRCLESIKRSGFADEIVVCIDAATTDASAEVARRYTRNLHVLQTAGHVESVLPQLASVCSGDFVLRVDDDERLGGAWDRAGFLMLAAFNDITAVLVPRRWIVPPGNAFLFDNPWFPDLQLRLFRNDADIIEWPQEVHTPMIVRGRSIVLFDRWLDHLNLIDTSRDQRVRKCENYLRMRPGHDLSHFYLWEGGDSVLMSCDAPAFASIKSRAARPCQW